MLKPHLEEKRAMCIPESDASSAPGGSHQPVGVGTTRMRHLLLAAVVFAAPVARENPAVAPLLGKAFRTQSEGRVYPLAGLLVEACAQSIGLSKVRDFLYSASAEAWEAQCGRAGSSAQELERAFRRLPE
jgi:hypothetical protein